MCILVVYNVSEVLLLNCLGIYKLARYQNVLLVYCLHVVTIDILTNVNFDIVVL